MDRRQFLAFALMTSSMLVLPSRLLSAATTAKMVEKIMKSDDEWKQLLSDEQYYILREEGTEARFTSPLNDEKREGVYACAGCGLELFPSAYKFNSGSGWPSFFDAIPGHLETKTDTSLFMTRTEYHCARCGGHHGHVFDDGPKPTGLRYCNNGIALTFKPSGG